MDPSYALAYNNVGRYYETQKKFPAAITYFKKSISLDPEQYLAYVNLGDTYILSANDYADAKINYEQALQSPQIDAETISAVQSELKFIAQQAK